MIPSIETILQMLLAGECTQAQAQAWINQHIELRSPAADAASYLTLAMGFGTYEVGAGTNAGVPCIAFGRNGSGVVGELVTAEPQQMSVEETIAIITFANVEGLDVLQEKMDEVRALHFSPQVPA